jgi:predicted ATPase
MKINKIKISGFKSIADIELNDLTPYSVFAGANGAGKSNFFDALKFLSTVITLGATQALRQFNGYENIHCFKHSKAKARTFTAEIECELLGLPPERYYLKIYDMDEHPKLGESFFFDDKPYLVRTDEKCVVDNLSGEKFPLDFPNELSYSILQPNWALLNYLKNIKIYRFYQGANSSVDTSTDTSELHSYGHNLATILSILEKDAEIREQIIEWMELLVPNLESISTERSRLDAKMVIRFKEIGLRKKFPVHLISDGTIYALCIMVAVLGRSKQAGMTLIEEPERGIHPKAIAELVNLMRENANSNHAIFVTTHSESVVRHSKPEELWLVNKIDGKSEFKNAAKEFSDLGDLNLDKAWLMNMFDGGLPW